MSRGARAVVKGGVESLLVRSGVATIVRSASRPYSVVLAYHNVVDSMQAAGDRSLHLPREAFIQQLKILERIAEVVPLEAILEEPSSSRRPRVAITFDDGYVGALTGGLEELARRSMPATFFIAPGFVGGGQFWWDAYADPALGAVEPDARDHALNRCAGDDDQVRQWAAAQGLPKQVVAPDACVASEELLHAAASIPGITFGSHTWSHPNLAALTGERLEAELTRSIDWLRERFHNVIPWIAYPYGLSAPEVEARCEQLGYRAGLRVNGGAFTSADAPFRLPRFNVPAGISAHGFELRLSRVIGA